MQKRKSVKIDEGDLIVKFLTDEISSEEIRMLGDWVASDDSNKAYFREMLGAWMLAGGRSYSDEEAEGRIRELLRRANDRETGGKKNLRLTLLQAAAAAVLLLVAGAAASWFAGRSITDLPLAEGDSTVIMSPYGSKTRVTLPDGSEIWLNAGSTLKYGRDFNVSDRKVSLTGEAFFSVKSDKDSPFFVNTRRLSVIATGTQFNVKSYPEENTETAILVEGKIDVEVRSSSRETEVITLRPSEKLVLTDEKLSVTGPETDKAEKRREDVPAPVKLDHVLNVNAVAITSWKEKRWIIEGEPLSSLVPMLERRYNLKFRMSEKELSDFRFSGTIENETVEQILEALALTAPIKFTVIKDSVILEPDENLIKQYNRLTNKNKERR